MVTANFFWHGPRLRLYESACLASFVAQGFTVRLHTFDPTLVVPSGVEICDAGRHASLDDVFKYSQNGEPGSIAAFSDIFRYRLFQQSAGWYFDTDVFCLRPASDFAALEKTSAGMIVGEQKRASLNGAVLFVSDPSIAVELEKRAAEKGDSFVWGAVGPALITEFAQRSPDRVTILGKEAFYPISHWEIDQFYLPGLRAECEAQAKGSYSIHLWNEVIGRWKISRDVMPPKASYLDSLFAAVGARADTNAAYPAEGIEALMYQANTDGWYRKFVDMKLAWRKTKKALKVRLDI